MREGMREEGKEWEDGKVGVSGNEGVRELQSDRANTERVRKGWHEGVRALRGEENERVRE